MSDIAFASRALMIQGCTSNAGKSVLVTALGRVLHRLGFHVAPFKPQNMALNSAVTAEGYEIGRAQAEQAWACGLEPHVDMNPILLKPNHDQGSQIIAHGKPLQNMSALDYSQFKKEAKTRYVLPAFTRLKEKYQFILCEGAGSPAEINLRQDDIANMGFAEAVDCPVWLVADIDRGGVFAQFVGTLELLSESERNRVQGLIINQFRGDIRLLHSGITWLENYTKKPVLGVLPYLHGLTIASEDSFFSTEKASSHHNRQKLHIAIFRLPRLSNHTDFDPLRIDPQVKLTWIETGDPFPKADLIILPGSKSVASDLAWIRENQWVEPLYTHLRYGGKVLGICGGFQMLGQWLYDPLKLESPQAKSPALSLLDFSTELTAEKILIQNQGYLLHPEKVPVTGYEIHMGKSHGPALNTPAMQLQEGGDHGVISTDHRIMGVYLHGLFDHPKACQSLLKWAGLNKSTTFDFHERRQKDLDRLADHVEKHIDLSKLIQYLQQDQHKIKKTDND
ncbi:cobyric acid synthase [Magnetococcales bacterium HHB-1]